MRASRRSAQYFFAMWHGPATVNTKILYLRLSLEYPIGRETYKNLKRRNKMLKTTYSTMLLVIGFLALMLTFPSAHLMAQTSEERSSVTISTSSTTEAPPAEERSSVTSSTRSTSFTSEAQASEEHHCVSHCRQHYEERLRECSEPGHEHHNRCEAWAREREKECLNTCK